MLVGAAALFFRQRLKSWATGVGAMHKHRRVATAERADEDFEGVFEGEGAEDEVDDEYRVVDVRSHDDVPREPKSLTWVHRVPVAVPAVEPAAEALAVRLEPPPPVDDVPAAAVSFCARKQPAKAISFAPAEPNLLLLEPNVGARPVHGVEMDD